MSFLYILSDVRSGSTLLAQLLGAHSQIASGGELQWLRAYALNDRRLYNPPHELVCGCGKTFADCEFWQSIAKRLRAPISEMKLILNSFGWIDPGGRTKGFHRRIMRRTLELNPDIFQWRLIRSLYGGTRVGTDSALLLDTILEETGARVAVDTSKIIFRFKSLYEAAPTKTKVVELSRDYRAVVYSQMKRGVSLEDSAKDWMLKARQMQSVLRGVPEDQIFRLRYEDLCSDPQAALSGICEFVGLSFETAMLSRPSSNTHDLGGSPSKFDSGRRQIRLDTSYLGQFTDSQIRTMQRVVGSAANRYGYS